MEQEKTETKTGQRRKLGRKQALLLFAGVFVVVAAAALLIVSFGNVNRSAKSAAIAAYEAAYGCDYESFMKASIYNETCRARVAPGVDEVDLKQLEAEFSIMREWMDETNETYHVKRAEVETYKKDSAAFAAYLREFSEDYGLLTEDIEELAKVTMTVTYSYDYEGEYDTDDYEDWLLCMKVGGKWYAFSTYGEEE